MFDGIRALRDHDDQMSQVVSWAVREVSYWAAAPHLRNFKRSNIYDHAFDAAAKKRMFKNTKPMKVTIDGKEQ